MAENLIYPKVMYYDANGNGAFNAGEFYMYVIEAVIYGDVILNTATQGSVVGKSVPTGAEIVFKIETNFGGEIPGACGDINLIDPNGIYYRSLDGQTLRDISLPGTTMYVGNPTPTTTAPPYTDALDLEGWMDTGTYTVKIESDKATCNMLDISSPEYEFTVRREELSIDAVKEVVYKGEDIILTITGYTYHYYYFAIENVVAWAEPHIKDTADIVSLGTGEGSPGAATAAWIKTGREGIAVIKICTYGADERTYTMHVYDTYHVEGAVPNETDEFGAPADVTGEKDEDDEKVKLEPVKVTFDIPKIVVIGGEVMIKGTVSGGDIVDILIEDGDIEYFNDEPVDKNKEFEVEWDTVGLTTGTYKINLYIDCLFDSFEQIEAAGIEPDGSTTIRLISCPYLDANLSKDTVPLGDSFELYGNTSFGYVEIVALSPEGGNGTGMEGLYGVSIYTVPTFITADTFSGSKIAIKGDEVEINALGRKIVYNAPIIFDVPTICIIGENLAVKGSASEGDSVDIAIDTTIKAVDIPIVENRTFYTAISTAGYLPGSYTIEGFIDGNYSLGEDVSGEKSDGTITIRLIVPGLTADQPKDEIARGSFYVVRGTATGVDAVDTAIIGPKGLTENEMGIEYGFALTSSSVSESEFEDEIFIPEDAEEGEYITFILSPGRDGAYAATGFGSGELEDALEAQGYEVPEDFVGKTQEQIIAMIKDATINVAGSDDLYVMLSFRVDGADEALNSFYKKIKVDSNADKGNYTILVLSPGIDGVYGESYYSYIDSILDLDGAGPEPGAIDVSKKTQEEIISIIKDATIDQAGSDDLLWRENIVITQFGIFDTGESSNLYPSISGTHNGTITPAYDINVSTLDTYACPGTGGHTEYAAFYNATTGEEIANARWSGYQGDYRHIEFDAPFTLHAKVTYNYTIKTGSYPQIIHAESKNLTGGVINCTEFIDANGRRYSNWIPAIRLE